MSDDTINSSIGKNLRAIRIAKKMTQTDVGKKIGVTFQQVQKYENGKNAIVPVMMMRIAKALDCSVTDLLCGLLNDAPKPFDWSSLLSRDDFGIVNAFKAIRCKKKKAALLNVARAMADG